MAAFALVGGGCGPGPGSRPTADLETIPDETRPIVELPVAPPPRSPEIRSLSVGLALTWTDPSREEPEHCRGSVSYERPGRLRLRGHSAAFFTVFDLVADGDEVWLDVPRERLLVHGRRSDPAWADLPVSPSQILIALLADPCPAPPCPEPSRSRSEPEGELRKGEGWSLRLHPETGLPVRYESGDLEILWNAWGDRRGMPWPDRIEIRRRTDDRQLVVDLGRVLVNRDVPGARFRFQPEEDREVLTPSEAATRWARAAPGLSENDS